MERFICIHGHFYQPPRENPWLEAIEAQDSAYPYHDWNERVAAECYGPNTACRILDREGRIALIENNYARTSFDMGPTLLAWLEQAEPDVYRAILGADRQSQGRFSGHGSALAQVYSHMIMPLANRRDKRTQVVWGLRDFEHRFGRRPEGMWLAETAVDTETLEVLVEQGISFTILAPHQARRVRSIGGDQWEDVSGGRIDPSKSYRLLLPSGRSIALFFYDGRVARAVAFGGLLHNGEDLVQRLMDGFSVRRSWPQLIHIATDGESYGHHHRYGDMALAYALEAIESRNLARLVNYGEYLEKDPPTYEVEIAENTSWSCPHGIERWRSNCGCSAGAHPGWSQEWRRPLREALDWLRDDIAPRYEEKAKAVLQDPWDAREDYIAVVLDRRPESVRQFLHRHVRGGMSRGTTVTALKLLELQRHAMLMYASCGWFFDDLSRIETVQVLQYAGRVLQLAQELFGDETEARFLERLEGARSNLPEQGDGRRVYQAFVKPEVLDWEKVGAHYAVASLFEHLPRRTRVHSYAFDRQHLQRLEAGEASMAVGKVRIKSLITTEVRHMAFAVLRTGAVQVDGGVQQLQDDDAYERMAKEVTQAFAKGQFTKVAQLMSQHLGAFHCSLHSLFRDELRKVLARKLDSSLVEAEAVYRRLYEEQAPLMPLVRTLGLPIPKALTISATFFTNLALRKALSAEELHAEEIRRLLSEAAELKVEMDVQGLAYHLMRRLEKLASRVDSEPADQALLKELCAWLAAAKAIPFAIDLWRVQSVGYRLRREVYPEMQRRAQEGDAAASAWASQFAALVERLAVTPP